MGSNQVDMRAAGRRRAGWVTGLALATLAPALAAGATVGIGVAAAPPAQGAPAGCTTTARVTTCTFDFTGAYQSWTPPIGVGEATFTVVGAAGGNAGGQPGGRGGRVVSSIGVTPGTVYRLYVGGKGGDDTASIGAGLGGWNGGGNGAGALNPGGGGGGGASDIRTAPYSAADRVIVAGGGGGAGSNITYGNAPHGTPGAGGAGGSTGAGNQGGNVSNTSVGAGGGGAGTATAPGFRGGPSSPSQSLYNGCGFWNPAYPTPGDPGVAHTGGAGGHLMDGRGSRCDEFRGWGGGGGGGWYGGGGGGGGITAGAGGGGGSGHAPDGSTAGLGQPGAHGQITITYSDWQSLGGVLTSAPTAAPRPQAVGQPDVHDLFYLDANSHVIQRVVTNGVPGPEHNLGAVLYPGSTVAAVWRSGGQRLDLFGRGTENGLWQKTFTWATGWGAWKPVPDVGGLTSSPTAASTSPERVDVSFARGDAGLTWLRIVDDVRQSLVSWAHNQPLFAPAAVAAGAHLSVFFATAHDAFFEDRKAPGIDAWSTIRWFGHRPIYSSAAVSAPNSAGVAVVMYRKGDSGLAWESFEIEADDAWPTRHVDWPAVPSPAGSAPALVTKPGGGMVVYLRGIDNTLVVRDFGGG